MSAPARALVRRTVNCCRGLQATSAQLFVPSAAGDVRSRHFASGVSTDRDAPYRTTFPARGADSKDAPVVVVLGWLKGSDRNLSKFSDVYDAHGCITVRMAVPSLPERGAGEDNSSGGQIVGLLKKKPFSERNVIFHVMSNGGSNLFLQILRTLQSDPALRSALKVRGTIYDSAPARWRLAPAMHAYSAHVANPLQRQLLKGILAVQFGAPMVVHRALAALGRPPPTLYDQIRTNFLRQPELYLHSKVDKVALCEDVEEMIAFRKALGIDVSRVCWSDTEHVSHLRYHRDEYVKQCVSFVDRCCGRAASP